MIEWMCMYGGVLLFLFFGCFSLSLYHLPHYSLVAQSLSFPLPPLSCRLFCLWYLLHSSLLVPRTGKTRVCGISPSLLLCLPPTPLLFLPHLLSSRPIPTIFLRALSLPSRSRPSQVPSFHQHSSLLLCVPSHHPHPPLRQT
ncbi:hypothetical protein HOY80DRAFT_443071 [Tuber brumale]|nr:hypothetical protein HOY80DRAFT_443071 [Tuber brumale]